MNERAMMIFEFSEKEHASEEREKKKGKELLERCDKTLTRQAWRDAYARPFQSPTNKPSLFMCHQRPLVIRTKKEVKNKTKGVSNIGIIVMCTTTQMVHPLKAGIRSDDTTLCLLSCHVISRVGGGGRHHLVQSFKGCSCRGSVVVASHLLYTACGESVDKSYERHRHPRLPVTFFACNGMEED